MGRLAIVLAVVVLLITTAAQLQAPETSYSTGTGPGGAVMVTGYDLDKIFLVERESVLIEKPAGCPAPRLYAIPYPFLAAVSLRSDFSVEVNYGRDIVDEDRAWRVSVFPAREQLPPAKVQALVTCGWADPKSQDQHGDAVLRMAVLSVLYEYALGFAHVQDEVRAGAERAAALLEKHRAMAAQGENTIP